MNNKLWWVTTNGAWTASLRDRKGGKAVADILRPEIKDLVQNLLSLGGERVWIPFEQNPKLCERFALVNVNKVILCNTEFTTTNTERSCFENSYRLWVKNKNLYRIAIGYGLNNYHQSWWPHTWLIDNTGDIIETGSEMSMYFGFCPEEEMLTYYLVYYGMYDDINSQEAPATMTFTEAMRLLDPNWKEPGDTAAPMQQSDPEQ